VKEAPRVLTPHPGEFARLTNLDTKSIQANREQHAANFAKCHGVVLLLKGARTVVTDGHQLAINRTGNNGMATGGSGDVLTGLLASLLAQGMSPFSAAQLGAHLHGLAGDLATAALGDRYLTSADLLDCLSAAWLRFGQADTS
jgi:NAD(P)H-hydrate epimerase